MKHKKYAELIVGLSSDYLAGCVSDELFIDTLTAHIWGINGELDCQHFLHDDENDTWECKNCRKVFHNVNDAMDHGKEYKEKCNNAKIGACFQWSAQCKEYDCYQ